MKVLICWNSQFLGRNGGMEKVFCNLSNELMRRGYQVSGVYCTEKTGEIYTPLDPKVKLFNLADWLPNKKWESARPLPYVLKREWLRLFNRAKMQDCVERFDVSILFDAVGGGTC